MMTNVGHLYFNSFYEKGYIVWDKGPGAVVIDPGCCNGEEIQSLLDFLGSHGLTPSAIVLTHSHFDHILGVKKLSARFGIPVYLHPDDRQMLQLAPSMAAAYNYYLSVPDISFETCDIKDGQILKIGDIEFEVIHTPGHTPGSVCLLVRESGDLFSGDTLFAGAIGRTDMPMGDYDKEIVSVMEKIMGLDADVKVHPGHGGATTIGYERTHNPFLQPFNEKDDQGNVDGIEFNG